MYASNGIFNSTPFTNCLLRTVFQLHVAARIVWESAKDKAQSERTQWIKWRKKAKEEISEIIAEEKENNICPSSIILFCSKWKATKQKQQQMN